MITGNKTTILIQPWFWIFEKIKSLLHNSMIIEIIEYIMIVSHRIDRKFENVLFSIFIMFAII